MCTIAICASKSQHTPCTYSPVATVWHHGSVTSSSPSKFWPKLYGRAKKHLWHTKPSCYIDCNFVRSCYNPRQHYMGSLLTCWWIGGAAGHGQNACIGSITAIAMSLQWSYSKRPQYLRRGFLYGKDEP